MFIKQDASNKIFYKEFLAESEKLQDVVKRGKERHFAFEDINADLFTMLYEPHPVDESGNIPMGLKIAKQNLDKIKELREYDDLHRLCQFDAMASGFGTQALAENFIKLLPQVPEDPSDLQAKKDIADQLGYKNASNELQQKIDAVNNYLAKVDPVIMDDEAVRQKMREALQGALKDTKDALDGMSAFGCSNDPGSMRQQGLKEKMELAKQLRNSKKLKEIAKIAGRFIRIAKKYQKQVMRSNTVSGVTVGDNLARVLPSELAKLSDPVLELLFYKNLAEKTLLEYELKSKESKAKGPIVMLVDESASMDGWPEYASKAVALAIMEIAKEQKRDFVLGGFSSENEYRELVAIKGQAPTLEILHHLEGHFSGGTDFQRPLSEGIKHISSSKFKQADLLFLTDGCAKLTPEFMDEYARVKAEKQFSCIGILIGHEAAVMQSFCDEIFKLDSLLDFDENNIKLHERIFTI